MKFCPKCATRNGDNAVICLNPGCRHRFADAGSGTVSKSTRTEAECLEGETGTSDGTGANDGKAAPRRYCPKCGTANAASAVSCVRCGASFPAPHPSPSPVPDPIVPPPTPEWRKWIAAVWRWSPPAKIAAVLALCIGIGMLSQIGGGIRGSSATTASARRQRDDTAALAIVQTALAPNFGSGLGRTFNDMLCEEEDARKKLRGMGYSENEISQMFLKARQENIRRGDLVFQMYIDAITPYPGQLASIQAERDQWKHEAAIQDIRDDMNARKLDRIERGFGVPEYVPKFGTGPTGSTITWDPATAARQNIPLVPWSMNTVQWY